MEQSLQTRIPLSCSRWKSESFFFWGILHRRHYIQLSQLFHTQPRISLMDLGPWRRCLLNLQYLRCTFGSCHQCCKWWCYVHKGTRLSGHQDSRCWSSHHPSDRTRTCSARRCSGQMAALSCGCFGSIRRRQLQYLALTYQLFKFLFNNYKLCYEFETIFKSTKDALK